MKKTGQLQRLIGLVVLGTALLAAALIGLAIGAADPDAPAPQEGVLFGVWHIMYDTHGPTTYQLLLAIAFTLALAAAIVLLEQRIATKDRRSLERSRLPLAPRIVMAETRGVYAGPVTITVLVPAHDEEAALPATLAALMSQSRPPDRVVVVADNCTDRTPEVARAAGAEVFTTIGNTGRKAGALNQALAEVLPDMGDNDTVMVMDADTALDDGFLAAAERRMTLDRALMAVGGLFYGEQGHGLIGQFQRNEYTRYSRDLKRRRGQVFVLTGTASVFRARALRTVAASRGRSLPGTPGDVYDTGVLTEDNELTIALKSLGALMVSPPECTVVTELMPAWRPLWKQRLRWQRGALENIGSYGVTPETARYWIQQFGLGYGVVALSAFLVSMSVLVISVDTWIWFPFWMAVGLIFTIERVATVWKGGPRARIVAALVLPELVYALFLDAVYVKGVIDISLDRQAQWGHLTHPNQGPGPAPGEG